MWNELILLTTELLLEVFNLSIREQGLNRKRDFQLVTPFVWEKKEVLFQSCLQVLLNLFSSHVLP